MNRIRSFKGIQFNPRKIDQLDKITSPPYDIITPEMQSRLYRKSKYNLVRLTLGKERKGDNERANKYLRAAKLFKQWRRKGILIRSKIPAIYPYQIKYEVNSQPKEVNGFFALIKLDPSYSWIKAHESTLLKPKLDRLNLMRAVKANLEPIEVLYLDEPMKVDKAIKDAIGDSSPRISVRGWEGFKHSLWNLADDAIIKEIIEQFEDKVLFIADGHHRYQTSIDFMQETLKKNPRLTEDSPIRYRMAVLVNMHHPGLTILPTHRLIHSIREFEPKKLLTNVRPYFQIEERSTDKSLDSKAKGEELMKAISEEGNKSKIFAFYPLSAKRNGVYYLLKLKDISLMDKVEAKHSPVWRRLDVAILHSLLLAKGLGISKEKVEEHVLYTKSSEEAISLVDEGKGQAAFLLNPTKIEELKEVVLANELMPQKSTYFLPKLLSGLVINPF
jgi:uncharacterized protein (DUF1015 family)